MFFLTIENCAMAIMFTLAFDKVMTAFRSFYGEKNISHKTIIDNRFFA